MTYPPSQGPPGQSPGQGWDAYGGQPPHQQAVCSWHPDRPTGLRCTRCGRPACPECLHAASVGQQCRQCVAEHRAATRQRTVSGSPLGVPPLVASILIGVNVACYIATAVAAASVNHPESGRLFTDYALIPLAVGDGEYWRAITSGFLHYGLLHIAVNMLSLYFLGPPLEQVIGRWRFAVVYLVSLLGGSAMVMVFSDDRAMSAGASGAIFGLMGALIVTFRRLKLDLRPLAGILVVNLVITFTLPGISWQAHLGGLVAGAAIGAAMVYPKPTRRRAIQVGAAVALVAVCAAVIVVRGATIDNDRCFYDPQGNDGPGVYCYTSVG